MAAGKEKEGQNPLELGSKTQSEGSTLVFPFILKNVVQLVSVLPQKLI